MNDVRKHITNALNSLYKVMIRSDQAIPMGIALSELQIALQELAAKDSTPEE